MFKGNVLELLFLHVWSLIYCNTVVIIMLFIMLFDFQLSCRLALGGEQKKKSYLVKVMQFSALITKAPLSKSFDLYNISFLTLPVKSRLSGNMFFHVQIKLPRQSVICGDLCILCISSVKHHSASYDANSLD